MTSSLVVHAGGRIVGVDELRVMPEPTSCGRRHTPIAHAVLVDLLREKADKAGLRFAKEAHALSADSATYFGVFDLMAGEDWAISLGLRNNHTRRMSAALAFGQRVFVCDNLAFAGDESVFRRHTSQILRDLGEEIEEALKRVEPARERFERRVKAYQEREFGARTSPRGMRQVPHDPLMLCRDLAEREAVPVLSWPGIFAEFAGGETAGRYQPTAWGFYNAITQVLTPRGDRPVLPGYAEKTAVVTAVFDKFAGMN